MRKEVKLIRNIIIIFLVLCGSYFFSDNYLSLENCVSDNLKGSYKHDAQIIAEIGEAVFALNDQYSTLYILDIERDLPFYRCRSTNEYQFKHNNCDFDVSTAIYNNRIIIYGYRFNKEIESIEIYSDDILIMILYFDNVDDDFDFFILPDKTPRDYQCYAYDKEHHLIGQKNYFKEEWLWQ